MSPPALLIAAHGTRDREGRGEALAMAGEVRMLAPGVDVACGFLELCGPSIADAAGALAGRGAEEIVVVPAMLFPAGHTTTDIPAAVDRERRRHPSVPFHYAGHLGIEGGLIEAAARRIRQAASGDAPVLLVGRGSSNDRANASLFEIARLLQGAGPHPFVEGCFSGISAPFVPEGLERCRRRAATRLVVAPWFLFTGVLVRRIGETCSAFEAAHPQMQIRVARHLWPDPSIPGLIVDRYRACSAQAAHARTPA